MFYVNDLRISYPHALHERVSVLWLFIYAFVTPLALLIVYNLLARSPLAKHEVTYLPFAISLVLTSFLTDVVKNAVGRPRPDLLDRCHPAKATQQDVLVNIEVCETGDSHKLQDGWRSFPSGHSSFSFAGLGFLALYMAGQLRVFHHPAGGRDLGRALLCLSPVLGATLVAISRCEDYRHDVYDVCVGSVLGMSVSYWSYRRHWPRLSSAWCHEPYPRPGTDLQSAVWQRVRDEEQAGASVGDEYELEASRRS
ncbi:hypothetical protein E4U41_007752 [Claviceps citrina]|nr:hypothetical protein E4U41_007752 [Claviceps citrina]